MAMVSWTLRFSCVTRSLARSELLSFTEARAPFMLWELGHPWVTAATTSRGSAFGMWKTQARSGKSQGFAAKFSTWRSRSPQAASSTGTEPTISGSNVVTELAPPNKRLKLAARVDWGMNLSSARRSLGAIRTAPTEKGSSETHHDCTRRRGRPHLRGRCFHGGLLVPRGSIRLSHYSRWSGEHCASPAARDRHLRSCGVGAVRALAPDLASGRRRRILRVAALLSRSHAPCEIGEHTSELQSR